MPGTNPTSSPIEAPTPARTAARVRSFRTGGTKSGSEMGAVRSVPNGVGITIGSMTGTSSTIDWTPCTAREEPPIMQGIDDLLDLGFDRLHDGGSLEDRLQPFRRLRQLQF